MPTTIDIPTSPGNAWLAQMATCEPLDCVRNGLQAVATAAKAWRKFTRLADARDVASRADEFDLYASILQGATLAALGRLIERDGRAATIGHLLAASGGHATAEHIAILVARAESFGAPAAEQQPSLLPVLERQAEAAERAADAAENQADATRDLVNKEPPKREFTLKGPGGATYTGDAKTK